MMVALLALTGIGFSVLGAYQILAALGMDIVVPTGEAAADQLPAGMNGIANLSLMHVQELRIELGIGAAIIAAILLVGAAIVSRLPIGEPITQP
jgi:hypothetical protein